ncbi:MAG: hypothetical protein GWN17_06465 [Candidatus Korarchaeota archaeon]|nr:hypothetical protein [Candidatus Korarchaeota archaeon]
MTETDTSDTNRNADPLHSVVFSDGSLLEPLACCSHCGRLAPESTVYPIRRWYRRKGSPETFAMEEMWCFPCLKDYFWRVRRIKLKRVFGRLYFK